MAPVPLRNADHQTGIGLDELTAGSLAHLHHSQQSIMLNRPVPILG